MLPNTIHPSPIPSFELFTHQVAYSPPCSRSFLTCLSYFLFFVGIVLAHHTVQPHLYFINPFKTHHYFYQISQSKLFYLESFCDLYARSIPQHQKCCQLEILGREVGTPSHFLWIVCPRINTPLQATRQLVKPCWMPTQFN